MKKKIKLVHSVGINDANYSIAKSQRVDGKSKQVWCCPFYVKWKSMLERCYSDSGQKHRPKYSLCTVIPEWHYFMAFKEWMEKQDWEGKHLDKDLLVPGNKVYGPDTCLFIESKVNNFLIESTAARGDWPIGVSFRKSVSKFTAQCQDMLSSKSKFLGYFDTPEEAHQAWLAFKLEQAYILAAEQTDPRVAKALIDRYENYGKVD